MKHKSIQTCKLRNKRTTSFRRIEHVPDTFRREALQKPQRITPSFSTSQLFFHNDLSRRSLLGRDRDIESRHGHSPQFFRPASNEAVNTCQCRVFFCLIQSLRFIHHTVFWTTYCSLCSHVWGCFVRPPLVGGGKTHRASSEWTVHTRKTELANKGARRCSDNLTAP